MSPRPSMPIEIPVKVDYFSREYFHGSYLHGKRSSNGHLITIEGDEYRGEFAEGLYHGRGTLVYAKDGKTYEGEWHKGQRHGQGKLFEQGRCFDGGWEKDRQKGKFVLTGEVTDDDKTSCQICYTNPINTAFYDCGHVLSCTECAANIDKCPICSRRVVARTKLFGVKITLD